MLQVSAANGKFAISIRWPTRPHTLSGTRRGDCVSEKVCHGTRRCATLAAYRMEEKTGEPFEIYRCNDCGLYHIGHSLNWIRCQQVSVWEACKAIFHDLDS